MRFGDLGQGAAGQVGVAEFQDLRGEGEQAPVVAHVAEVDQGEQDAAGAGAVQAAGLGHFGEGEFRAFG